MSNALYMDDSYLKEWDATVTTVTKDRFIALDNTAFFPKGGGVEWDCGTITKDDKTYNVIYTGKFSGDISHEVDQAGIQTGDKVHCTLDWDRRYTLMRYHTACHVLSGVFFKEYDLKVTGNQLTQEKGRIDLNMETMDTDLIKEAINRSNDIINKDLSVETYYLSKQEALEDKELFKLAMGFPHDIDTIRIVDIKGFDRQADGGCHVKHLKEIGIMQYVKTANKGKNFKRVYFTIQ